jgi:taurine--2-oxoglutarate transaminase
MTPAEITARYTYGTWRRQKGWKPLHVVDAEGSFFIDETGKRYLDFSSQLMCSTLGHKNEAVIAAVAEQARKLAYVAPGFSTDARVELTKVLLDVLPAGLEKFFFTTSGCEANECAFKIAHMYTGKHKIISRYCSYHGSTMGAIAATGDFRRWAMEPGGKVPGVIFAPEVNCFRCVLGHRYPGCGIACAEYIGHMIENESDVAAVLVEPVVGTNGILIPPREYMPRLRQICDANGVLLIADEVMSGWGRTGTWFAMDHWDVVPDILTTAKGISGAYVPLGLCATSKKIADFFEDHFFSHGHTYEAHPITLAPAVAAINEMKRMSLVERSREMGEYMLARLSELKEKHVSVGDVHGLGLFWSVVLVKDRKTNAPFNTYKDKLAGKPTVVERVSAEMMKNGVYLIGWVSHFVIAPPLTVSKDEIDLAVKTLDAALAIADAEVAG